MPSNAKWLSENIKAFTHYFAALHFLLDLEVESKVYTSS